MAYSYTLYSNPNGTYSMYDQNGNEATVISASEYDSYMSRDNFSYGGANPYLENGSSSGNNPSSSSSASSSSGANTGTNGNTTSQNTGNSAAESAYQQANSRTQITYVQNGEVKTGWRQNDQNASDYGITYDENGNVVSGEFVTVTPTGEYWRKNADGTSTQISEDEYNAYVNPRQDYSQEAENAYQNMPAVVIAPANGNNYQILLENGSTLGISKSILDELANSATGEVETSYRIYIRNADGTLTVKNKSNMANPDYVATSSAQVFQPVQTSATSQSSDQQSPGNEPNYGGEAESAYQQTQQSGWDDQGRYWTTIKNPDGTETEGYIYNNTGYYADGTPINPGDSILGEKGEWFTKPYPDTDLGGEAENAYTEARSITVSDGLSPLTEGLQSSA